MSSDKTKKTKPKIQIDLSKVEALAANGLTQQQIADSLGISERTLYNSKRDNADFAEAIKRGRAKGIAVVTNKLMEQCKNGNTTAIIFFLKTQAGWKETTVNEHTGKVISQIEKKETLDLSGLTLDELEQLETLINKSNSAGDQD